VFLWLFNIVAQGSAAFGTLLERTERLKLDGERNVGFQIERLQLAAVTRSANSVHNRADN